MGARLTFVLTAVFISYGLAILSGYHFNYPEVASSLDLARFITVVLAAKFFFVFVLAAAAFGAGGLVFRRWMPDFASLLEEGVIKVALGLTVISLALFAAGLAGLLYRPLGFFLLAACIAGGVKDISRYIAELAAAPRRLTVTLPVAVLLCIAAFSLFGGLYGGLLPPTGFDTLMYHLGVPKKYLAAHSIYPTPDINGSYFPFGTEMLYMLAMMVESPVSAKMVNYFLGVMGGLAAVIFARRFLKGPIGLLSFTIYVSMPMVIWLMGMAYIGLSQAAYTMLALVALFASFREDDRKWLVVAAVLGGFTMSIKYTGVIIVVLMACIVVFHVVLSEKKGVVAALSRAAFFAAVAAAVCSPWYIKNFFFYGNPVFPFLAGLFGHEPAGLTGVPSHYWSGGPVATAVRFLGSFYRTTLDAVSFKMGWNNGLGPYFLMFIPGVFMFRKIERELKYLALFCLGFYCILVTKENIRYLSPVFPALCVIAAYPAGRLMADKARSLRALGGVLVVVFAFSAIQAQTPQARIEGHPSLSSENTDAYYKGPWSGYLASYEVWKWINEYLPEDAVIYQLWDEASVYFRQRKTIGSTLSWDAHGRQRIHFVTPQNSFGGWLPGEQIIANLREMGADYFLINANREGRELLPEDPYLKANLTPIVGYQGVFLFQVRK